MYTMDMLGKRFTIGYMNYEIVGYSKVPGFFDCRNELGNVRPLAVVLNQNDTINRVEEVSGGYYLQAVWR